MINDCRVCPVSSSLSLSFEISSSDKRTIKELFRYLICALTSEKTILKRGYRVKPCRGPRGANPLGKLGGAGLRAVSPSPRLIRAFGYPSP